MEDRLKKTLETLRTDLKGLDLELPDRSGREQSLLGADLPIADQAEPLREVRELFPAPKRRRSRAPLLASGAFVLLAAAAAAALLLRRPSPPPDDAIVAIPFPTQDPIALAVMRGAFLAVDEGRNELVKLDPGSSRVIERLPLPLPLGAEKPVAAARVGPHLWLAKSGSRILQRYSIDGGMRYAGSADLSDILPAESRLAGMAQDGPWLWILTSSPSTLYRIPIGRIRFS